MEQDKYAVLDLSEGKEHGGGIAPAAGPSGEVADAEGVTEPEGVLAVDNAGHSASLESAKSEDLEVSDDPREVSTNPRCSVLEFLLGSLEQEPLLESEGVAAVSNSVHGAASGSTKNEDYELFNNPAAIRFEFRATAANTTPPSTNRRLPSRSRKLSVPTHFFAAGAAASASVSGSPEDASAVVDADQDAASGSDKNKDDEVVTNERKACLGKISNPKHSVLGYFLDSCEQSNLPVSGATAANATPPSTYRLLPSRSRKQSRPTHFITAGGPASAGAHATSDPPPPVSHGSTLPSASPSGIYNAIRSALDAAAAKASSDAKDAAAASCSSYRLHSRGSKLPRPDHFIPEEAEARARAKAHRSNIVLDRFLSSLVRGSSERRPEWVRNVTADGVRDQRQRGTEGFEIRDVSHHAACVRGLRAAISRFEATSDPSSSARPGYALPSATASGGPEEPDESGTIFSVLAILGASLALSVVSCVLFYIVGHRTESGQSGEQQKK